MQSNLVATYEADSNWGNYLIKPISEYPYDVIGAQWQEVINNTTTYATDYAIGKTLPIVYNNTVYQMELVAFDVDERADGDTTKNNGKARMTWICKDLIGTHNMNSSNTNANGWPNTAMRSWLRSTVWNQLPEVLQNNIVEVNKTYYDYTSKTTKTSADTIWIPSIREIFNGTSGYTEESSGTTYVSSTKFNNNTNRIKKLNNSARNWWLRSANSSYSGYFWYVGSGGAAHYGIASDARGVAPGFCI